MDTPTAKKHALTFGVVCAGMLLALAAWTVVPDLVWLHRFHRQMQLQEAAAALINAERAKQQAQKP